jgi:hypothetical protein
MKNAAAPAVKRNKRRMGQKEMAMTGKNRTIAGTCQRL